MVEQRQALPPVLRQRLRRLRVVLAAVADGAPEVGPHAVAPHRALLVAAQRVPEEVLGAEDPPATDHLDRARSARAKVVGVGVLLRGRRVAVLVLLHVD